MVLCYFLNKTGIPIFLPKAHYSNATAIFVVVVGSGIHDTLLEWSNRSRLDDLSFYGYLANTQ